MALFFRNNPKTKMLAAFWLSNNTGLLLLDHDWQDIWRMPPIKLSNGMRIKEIIKMQPQLAGTIPGYYFPNDREISFILLREMFPRQYLTPETKIYVAGEFNGWQNAIGDPAWQLQIVQNNIYNLWELRVPRERVFGACNNPKPMFKFVTAGGEWLNPNSATKMSIRDIYGNENLYIDPARTGQNVFRFVCEKPINFRTDNSKLIWSDKKNPHEEPILKVYLNSRIHSSQRLGALVRKNKTTFRIFAPRASGVILEFWREQKNRSEKWRVAGTQNRMRIPMESGDNGVWEANVNENLDGAFYQFFIDGENIDNTSNFDASVPVLDPWAVACVGPAGPGIVIDVDKRLPLITKPFHPPHLADCVIGEMHLRDLIARVPEFADKKDLGFRELTQWIRGNAHYIRRLGINAIELQPLQQFDAKTRDEYHWGYMTNNFFAPASNYASDANAGTQVEEFRELVQALHECGLTVILDVVYNHVGEPNHLMRIDKSYYFDLDPNGNFTNWSGCGNDLNANNPMTRRLICESLMWMMERYGVDGFRFDLGEIVGLSALKAIETCVRERFPNAILIAEPWSFRGNIAYSLRDTTFSSWNDGFRDYCAKYVHNHVNLDGFRYLISGSLDYLTTFPSQTINYTESHDDRCWLDKITECNSANAENPTENDIRRSRIMFAILLSALGTPMIAEGQDFLRTKHGKNNTYLDGVENALDYAREQRFAEFANYVRRWIKFRLSARGRLFRQRHRVPRSFFRFYPDQTNTAAITVYNYDNSQGTLQYLLMLNPQRVPAMVQAQSLNLSGFRQIANSHTFSVHSDVPRDPGFLHENGIFTLPPLSVSLWIKESY